MNHFYKFPLSSIGKLTFAGVLLIGALSTVGCGSEPTAQQEPTQQAPATPVDASTEEPDPWGEAVSNAMQAAELAQTAQSADEWEQVKTLWNQASTLMAQVPESHPEFATAQQKVNEYSQNAQVAEQRNVSAQQIENERCSAVREVVASQLRIDGFMNPDAPNFKFSCSDNGSNLSGEYSQGRMYVAIRAQSSDPTRTLEFKPLGPDRSQANNSSWQPW